MQSSLASTRAEARALRARAIGPGSLVWLVVALAGCAHIVRRDGFSEVQSLASQRGVSQSLEWQEDEAGRAAQREAVQSLLARDLTPETAVQVALLNNPSLQATYEELGIAQADVVQAGLLKNPTVTAAALFGGVSPSYDFDLVKSFLDALLIPARTRITEAQFGQVRFRAAASVFELTAEVLAAFYTLQGAEQLVDVLRVVLDSTAAASELAQALHAAGNLSDLQLATERALVEDVRADLMRARAETVEPREDLRELLGLSSSDSRWQAAHGLPGVPDRDPPLSSLLGRAADTNLEIAAANQQQLVLSEALATARAWRYFGGVEVGAETHREQGESNWIAGPSISLELPLFDQQQAEIFRLESQLRQSERRAESVALSVAANVRRAYGALDSARTLAEQYKNAILPIRKRVVALSQEQYGSMHLGGFDLLRAKREEITGYSDYVRAVRDYWIARARLERAVGARIPLEGPLESTTVALSESHRSPPSETRRDHHHHGEH